MKRIKEIEKKIIQLTELKRDIFFVYRDLIVSSEKITNLARNIKNIILLLFIIDIFLIVSVVYIILILN